MAMHDDWAATDLATSFVSIGEAYTKLRMLETDQQEDLYLLDHKMFRACGGIPNADLKQLYHLGRQLKKAHRGLGRMILSGKAMTKTDMKACKALLDQWNPNWADTDDENVDDLDKVDEASGQEEEGEEEEEEEEEGEEEEVIAEEEEEEEEDDDDDYDPEKDAEAIEAAEADDDEEDEEDEEDEGDKRASNKKKRKQSAKVKSAPAPDSSDEEVEEEGEANAEEEPEAKEVAPTLSKTPPKKMRMKL